MSWEDLDEIQNLFSEAQLVSAARGVVAAGAYLGDDDLHLHLKGDAKIRNEYTPRVSLAWQEWLTSRGSVMWRGDVSGAPYVPPSPKRPPARPCAYCGQVFQPKAPRGRFCKQEHRRSLKQGRTCRS